jgi:hypothetical protein
MSTYPIPDAALDSDIAILGKKGGGKTYTAKGIVERLLDMGRRVLVLDPLGVWAGLRTGADGKSPGYPIAIFGGPHGDLPLDPAAAAPMANVLAAENVPAVIDLSELTKHAQQSFLLAFLHELRRVNTAALTLVLEEADVFAPQQPLGDDSKMLHSEIDWIARRGRFRGFRLVTVTQRPARLSKDVLTQCATLISHRLPAPQDRDAVKAWVDGNGDRDRAREVFDTLAQLAVGEAWVWASEEGTLQRERFPKIKTLDTSATPKAGEKRVEPKTLADVDLTGIRAALEEAKQTKGQKAGSKAASEDHPSQELLNAARREGHKQGFGEGVTAERANALHYIDAAISALQSVRERLCGAPEEQRAAPVAYKTNGSRPPPAPRGERPAPQGLHGAAVKMLAVLDTNPPVRRSWTQAATLAGLKARGGHFNAGRKALIDAGLVKEEGGLVCVARPSADATSAVHDPEALVDMWAGSLSGAAPKILKHLFGIGGRSARIQIANSLGMQPHGGYWNAAWKELRDNEIVRVDGDEASLTELFRGRA